MTFAKTLWGRFWRKIGEIPPRRLPRLTIFAARELMSIGSTSQIRLTIALMRLLSDELERLVIAMGVR